MHHAIEDARHYARETTRDPWLIAVWVMEFRTLSTYQARQWLRARIVYEVNKERAYARLPAEKAARDKLMENC